MKITFKISLASSLLSPRPGKNCTKALDENVFIQYTPGMACTGMVWYGMVWYGMV